VSAGSTFVFSDAEGVGGGLLVRAQLASEADVDSLARAALVPDPERDVETAEQGAGIDIGSLLGGAIVTEVVFGLPGLGREAVQAIDNQDLPIILGVTLLSAAAVVGANLAVDLAQALLDPRVRLEFEPGR
jgi:hypothetical protein